MLEAFLSRNVTQLYYDINFRQLYYDIINFRQLYYDIIDFPQIKKNSHPFSIFQLNISTSLSAHLEELQLLLNALKIVFDVIGTSETKEQSGGFLKNVDLHGYTIPSQHSNSEAGGVAFYVKSNLDYIIRDVLNVLENEFQTIWVKMKNITTLLQKICDINSQAM